MVESAVQICSMTLSGVPSSPKHGCGHMHATSHWQPQHDQEERGSEHAQPDLEQFPSWASAAGVEMGHVRFLVPYLAQRAVIARLQT